MNRSKSITYLFFCLCFVGTSFSQNQYSFPKGTTIYDLPGGNFLTHVLKSNKAYIQEYNQTGDVVWMDSLNTDFVLSTVDTFLIQRFGETDQYAFFLIQNKTSDSIHLRYSKFTRSNHQIEPFLDTLLEASFGFRMKTCSISDSLIYLISNINSGYKRLSHNVLSLDLSLNLNPIASSDSVKTKSISSDLNFYRIGDTILEVYNDYGNIYTQKFSTQFAKIQLYDSSKYSPEYDFCSALHVQLKSPDSLFVFNYGYVFSTNQNAWDMRWYNAHLNEFSAYQNSFSILPDTSYYTVNYTDIAITSDLIYVLGTFEDGSQNHPHRIFVFDNQFQPQCDFEVGVQFSNDFSTGLTVVNNLPYFFSDSNNLDLIRIAQCGLATTSLSEQNNHVSDDSFQLFPNPTNKIFTLTGQNLKGKKAVVCSILGEVIALLELDFESKNEVQLNLKPGVYFLKIDSKTQQFIVQ